MKIKYTIDLLSDWHCGAGLNAGAEADIVVLKDENNLPYIPGKTIKGLLRDSLMDIIEVQSGSVSKTTMEKFFGKEVKDKDDKVIKTIPGCAFFSNAVLKNAEENEIISHHLSNMLYKNIASTAIEKKTGVAQQNSLRVMEVCQPLTLEGYIESEEDINIGLFENAFKWTRHLGTNRNRGLGRCKFLKAD